MYGQKYMRKTFIQISMTETYSEIEGEDKLSVILFDSILG
jgi:hypothetical protein